MSDRKSRHPPYPEGPSAQYLATWDLGNSNSSTGFGQVYDYWVLGPLTHLHVASELGKAVSIRTAMHWRTQRSTVQEGGREELRV